VRPDPRPVQPSTVLARSRTLRAGSAGAADCAATSLTAAARGALPGRQVGTWRNRGTGSVLVPINANGARPCPQQICINMSVSTCP
jgi:hypothetical protein